MPAGNRMVVDSPPADTLHTFAAKSLLNASTIFGSLAGDLFSLQSISAAPEFPALASAGGGDETWGRNRVTGGWFSAARRQEPMAKGLPQAQGTQPPRGDAAAPGCGWDEEERCIGRSRGCCPMTQSTSPKSAPSPPS